MGKQEDLYANRQYRKNIDTAGRVSFRITVEQSDLFITIGAPRHENMQEETVRALVLQTVQMCRQQLQDHIRQQKLFLTSLQPLAPEQLMPQWIHNMYHVTEQVGVGPMAAVAGAVAQCVGEALHRFYGDIVVENGGDVWMTQTHDGRAVVDCGGECKASIVFVLHEKEFPLGLCTSSGKIGHSLSFGLADAATVKAKDAALADAAATALGNRVRSKEDIETALAWIKNIKGVSGAFIAIEGVYGFLGDMEIADSIELS